MDLGTLPDSAQLRVIPSHPPLSDAAAAELQTALHKLFQQFVVEGRCITFAMATEAQGSLLLLAWQGAALSGCSHDKIGKVLAHIESRHGVALLAPPPLLVETGEGPQCLTHQQFREQVKLGQIDDQTRAWDTLATDLERWRQGACRPIAEHWLQPLWQRSAAVAP